MENMTGRVERMVRKSAKRRLWHRAVAIPAAIVVFITTYALILPAIAMERDTYCGLEAHQHGEECYTAELACGFEDGAMVQDVQTWSELTCSADVHQHTEACFDEDGNVICGLADYVVHTHNADCYNAQGELVCTLPEVEAHTHDDSCYVEEIVNVCGQSESEGHVHTADCYTMVSHPELICGQVESEGHVHTADCYTTFENTYLACGQEESAGHVHDASCYTTVVAEDGTETTELTCTLPESLGHVHTDACYVTETVTELTCGKEESAGHIHTDACWADVQSMELTCGKEETAGHTHTEACFATEKRLVCTKPEVILHTHGDECYTVVGYAEDGSEIKELTCPMTVVQEHVHTADCFTQVEQTVERPHEHTELCYVQVLTCTLPEHEHTDECYVAPAEPEVTEAPAYICGLEEHAHTDVCYDENGELICGLEEHIHDETCLAAEIVEGDTTEIVDGDVEIVEDETPHFQLPVLVCGLSEHEHSTNCMDENMNYVCGLAQHTHTGECYDIPGMDGVTPELTCALHEHFHTEACYNENGELACGLEEHTHTVGCFTLPEGAAEPEVIGEPALPTWCGMEEHTHDETCYDETGALVCGLIEHTHDDSCFVEPTWYCGFVAHTHDESCMDANGEPICGLIEHTHDASCMVAPTYYCGKAEHTHGETCYDEAGNLVCGLEEHTHDDSCLIPPVYYCGKAEHIHDENCYDENGELICGLEEHIHDAGCLIQNFVQMAEADGILVTAEYTSEAGIPEQAQLRVTRFTEGDHFEDRANEASEAFCAANPDQSFQTRALLNIGFYLADGAEVEPLAPVDITVQLLDASGLPEGDGYTIVHFASDGTELLDVESGSDDQVAFTTDSFSDFIIGDDADPSDGGSSVAENEQETAGEPESTEDGTEPTGTTIDPSWAPFSSGYANYVLGTFSNVPTLTYGSYGITGGSTTPTATVFEHNKTIDYLGDNGNYGSDKDNPDTTVDDGSGKVTDDLYRLYLDMEGESKPVDLLLVLDRSGSMYGDGDKDVEQVLFGTNSLLKEFLAANEGKSRAEDKNHVAMVWYAGKEAIYWYSNSGPNPKDGIPDDGFTKYNSTGRYGVSKIDPYNGSEGGVCFDWKTSYNDINYNYSSMVEGGVDAVLENGSYRKTDVATNYVAGFVWAHDMLNAAPAACADHKKVVVFISDGVPTLYYSSADFATAWGNETALSSLTRYGYGTEGRTFQDFDGVYPPLIYNYVKDHSFGYTTQDKTAGATEGNYSHVKSSYYTPLYATAPYDNKYITREQDVITNKNLTTLAHSPYFAETLGCFEKFWESHKDVDFFTLGINMSGTIDSAGKFDRYYALDGMAAKYGRQTLKASDAESLKKALRQVMFPSGVSISDKLSTYVDLYTTQPDVKVTATNKQTGLVIPLWEGCPGNAAENTVEGETNVISSVAYDNSTKTITVNFRDDYCLNKNYTYTLSFNVRLTAKAYDDYAAMQNKTGAFTSGQYPDVGDKDGTGPAKTETTDYGDNETSSGMGGFLSNADAHVKYTIDTQDKKQEYTLPYDDPVVQAWGTKFKVLKTADDKTGGVPNIPFQLKKDGTTVWNIAMDSYGNPLSAEGGWYLTGKDGIIDFGFLPGGTYELWEKVPAEYSSTGVGKAEGTDRTVKWLTFTVQKGRIINMDVTGTGVTWEGDAESTHASYDFNSTPGTNYLSGKAMLTVENKSNQKQLKIFKKDEKGENLPGASFQLQKKNNSGNYEPFDLETLKDESAWYSPTDKDGLVFDGKLPNGDYKLVETDAPDNYERLTKGVEFKVDSTGVKIVTGPDSAAKVNQEGDVFTLTIHDSILTTTSWEIIKQDDSSNNLAGAQFTLYGPYDVERTEDNYSETECWSFTTGNNGKPVDETGKPELTAGKWYYLKETSAPAGYNLMEDIIELQVKEVPGTTSKDRTLTLEAKAKDGSESTGFKSDGAVTVSYDDNSMTGTLTITVENYTGYELPESGGIGTTVFYVGGLTLIAMAGAVFCARKRREAQG